MKRSPIWLVPLLLAGCVTTSNVPTEITEAIPRDARVIKLYSDQRPAEYYRTIYRALAGQGFSMRQENADMGTFSTDFKEIGQETTLRINAFLEESPTGSVAPLRGQWGVTASMGAGLSAAMGANLGGTSAEDADWGDSDRPKAAFREMAVIASSIPHQRLEYSAE